MARGRQMQGQKKKKDNKSERVIRERNETGIMRKRDKEGGGERDKKRNVKKKTGEKMRQTQGEEDI